MNQPDPNARFFTTDDVRKDLKTRSVRGAAFIAAGSAGEFFLRLLSTIVLARLLLPEHFGLIGMVTAVTEIAGWIRQLGLATATVQRKNLTHGEVTNLFWINAAFGTFLCLLLCALAVPLADFYRDPRLVPVTMAISTSLLFGGLMVQHDALLDRQMKQAQSMYSRLGASVISTAIGILLALHDFNYWALVWQEVTRSIVVLGAVWFFCRWRPGLPRRDTDVRSFLRTGIHLTLNQLITSVVSNLDRMLLGRFYGAAAVGMFRQAQQLMMAPVEQIIGPIHSVSQPGLSMLQNDPDRYRQYYRKIVFSVSLLTMPVAMFAGIYAGEISLVVLGPKWTEAAPLLRIFAVAAFIRPVLSTSGVVMITCGHTGRLLKLTAFRSVCMVLLLAAGIQWGTHGLALAQVGTTIATAVPTLAYGLLHTPVSARIFFHALSMPAFASLVMGCGVVLFRAMLPDLGDLKEILAGCGVGALLYGACCLAFARPRAEVAALFSDLLAAAKSRRKAALP